MKSEAAAESTAPIPLEDSPAEDATTEEAAVEQAPTESLRSRAKEVSTRLKAHNVVVIGAGIAFYALLALIPTLVGLISLYALVTDPADIAEQISGITDSLEPGSAALINDQLEIAVEEAKASGAVTLAISILLALWAASGALQKLISVIALAYGAIETRPGWKVRATAYGFTAGGIVFVAVAGFAFGALPALMDQAGIGGGARILASSIGYLAMFGFMLVSFTVLYRYGPDRQPRTPWKNPGAPVGAVMFLVFATLFTLYFRYAAGALPASYGILGSIAAIIIFFQLTAIAIVIGAEINAMNEDAHIDPLNSFYRRDKKPADPLSFGKAAAALAALFIMGRQNSK